MLDGISLERAGVPTAAICTDRFEPTAKATAELQGAERYPVLYTEHPISSADREQLEAKARALVDEVVRVLTS